MDRMDRRIMMMQHHRRKEDRYRDPHFRHHMGDDRGGK